MAVTSLENLKKLSEGQEVELPGWDEEPFICKLKRPSLLGLVEGGQIPNPLLNAAYILFNGAKTQKDVLNLKDQKEILDIVARAAMVEPTYQQLKDIGLELTDLQLLDIYNFTQLGVRSLISFRTKQGNIKDYKDKREIQPKA
jgi:hypothetical protein